MSGFTIGVCEMARRLSDKEADLATDRVDTVYWILIEWIDEGKITLLNVSCGGYPNVVDHHIALLLGYEDGFDMALNWREESSEVVRLFSSPNGWAVYQMLLAKRHGGSQ